QNHRLGVVEDLSGEIALALQLRLEVLDVSNVEKHAAVLQNLPLAVAHHERVFERMDHGAIAAAERNFKVPDSTGLVQLAQNLVALFGRDVDLALEIELQDLFPRLITQHPHEGVIDFNEVAFGRSEEYAFLHVVKQLAVTALGFAAVGNIFKDVDGLQAF